MYLLLVNKTLSLIFCFRTDIKRNNSFTDCVYKDGHFGNRFVYQIKMLSNILFNECLDSFYITYSLSKFYCLKTNIFYLDTPVMERRD